MTIDRHGAATHGVWCLINTPVQDVFTWTAKQLVWSAVPGYRVSAAPAHEPVRACSARHPCTRVRADDVIANAGYRLGTSAS